jgi:hypothetical protein
MDFYFIYGTIRMVSLAFDATVNNVIHGTTIFKGQFCDPQMTGLPEI